MHFLKKILGFISGEWRTHKSPRAPSSETSVTGLRGLSLDLYYPFQVTFDFPYANAGFLLSDLTDLHITEKVGCLESTSSGKNT